MTKTATAVAAIPVLESYDIDGVQGITVSCPDYDAFQALPGAVTFEGRLLGRSGWNSDRGIACFQSNVRLAIPRS